MRLYALVEAGDPETIDLFVLPEDAECALAECLLDEPAWSDVLHIEEIKLDVIIAPN